MLLTIKASEFFFDLPTCGPEQISGTQEILHKK